MEFFETDAGFLLYTGLLLVSGVLLLVLAGLGFGSRAVNAIIGVLAIGYGAYLGYVYFNGGNYRIFIYAFILPIVAIYQLVKGIKERNAEADAAAAAAAAGQFPTAPPAA